MLQSEKILSLIDAPLANAQVYLVDMSIDAKNNIKIILDSDKAVSLSDCITISRAIENNLSREDEDFSLEVTSAGLGQPLKQERQYRKCIGKEIEVLGKDGKKYFGTLMSLNNDSIQLLKSVDEKKGKSREVENKDVLQILFTEIKQTKAIVKI